MAGPFGPFESTFERLGDTLINKVADEIFGDSGAARQTIVVVYNHGSQDLFYLSSSFESGGFTAGAQPGQIAAEDLLRVLGVGELRPGAGEVERNFRHL